MDRILPTIRTSAPFIKRSIYSAGQLIRGITLSERIELLNFMFLILLICNCDRVSCSCFPSSRFILMYKCRNLCLTNNANQFPSLYATMLNRLGNIKQTRLPDQVSRPRAVEVVVCLVDVFHSIPNCDAVSHIHIHYRPHRSIPLVFPSRPVEGE